MALLQQAERTKAVELLEQALTRETRAWVRREILALQVLAFNQSGNNAAGAQRFIKLLNSDEQTRFFGRIPLLWPGQRIGSPEAVEAGKNYLQSDNEVIALIGASWSLSGSRRNEAIKKLNELSTSIDARIAYLARAQRWQTNVLTASTGEVGRWKSELDRMPVDLKAGPTLVIGSAMARLAKQSAERDQAVIWLMRIPILYPEQFQESAEALLQAARLLEAAQRPQEAKAIYLELINGYRETSAFNKAADSSLVQELMNK